MADNETPAGEETGAGAGIHLPQRDGQTAADVPVSLGASS